MTSLFEAIQIVSGIVFFGMVLLSLLGAFDFDGLDAVDVDVPDAPEFEAPDIDSADGAVDGEGDADAPGGGWSLWSLAAPRPLSAGLFVGSTTAVWLAPVSVVLAAAAMLVTGTATAAATAEAVRRMSRLEEDNTVSINEALYERCRVTAAVFPGRRGAVELTLRGQTVELPAVSDVPLSQGDVAYVAALSDGVATLSAADPVART